MLKALIGRKLNMSQVWDSHGRVTPVTKLSVEPNTVVILKDKDTDGYKAAQVGVGNQKKPTKPLKGHFDKAKLKIAPSLVREVDFEGDIKAGQEITVDEVFHKGSLVDVVGTSKGKGFAGVIKRYGFHGGPKTHGQSDRHRAAGSIGSGTTPGRVQKGLKMAGRLGSQQVSVLGLEVMEVNKDENTLLVKGSVPGSIGESLIIKKSTKKKAAYHEPEIPAVPQIGGGGEEKTESETQGIAEGLSSETGGQAPVAAKEEKEGQGDGKDN
nr:hypothetical protein [uncultured archaeon]